VEDFVERRYGVRLLSVHIDHSLIREILELVIVHNVHPSGAKEALLVVWMD